MKVRVLLFASYADALGADSVVVDAQDGVTAAEVLALVQRLITVPVPPRPLVAINATYAAGSDVVREGDEVAIIPPVAGG
jgi:sulfur-carrier protein